MTKSQTRNIWVAGGIISALLIMAAVVALIWQANRSLGTHGPLISDQALDEVSSSDDVVVVGTIGDGEGRAIENATVALSLHNGDGQMVWRLTRPVAKDGSFRIRLQDLPAIPNLYAGVIAAEAPNYLAEKANVSVDIVGSNAVLQTAQQQVGQAQPSPQPNQPVDPDTRNPLQRKTTISPHRIHLKLIPYSPWLTLLVLIPALFGLILAILHITQFARGLWVTYWYALGVAALWGVVVAGLVLLYVGGKGLIPLFWSDLFVSSGIIVFAFIGNIIYVAYSLNEKGPGFFESDDNTRKKILLALGGRILVAPYIALAAYGIFAATFPTLRTGPFAAFFGFFTGLWIKPVLEALNDIGSRLLSAESQQKIADRVTRTEVSDAPPQQTSSALALRPEQAFLDAVKAAREELLTKKGVIGVDAGFKATNGNVTGERAIVVYVYEKQEPSDANDRVPETFMGFPTDVLPLPPAVPNELCRQQVFNVSWEKLHEDNTTYLKSVAALPQDQPVGVLGEVLVLSDPSLFFKINGKDQQEFDAKRAYQALKSHSGDKFDFVLFLMDRPSGVPFVNNYNVPVHHDVKGIGEHFKGKSYSVRGEWNTTKLLACQVISLAPPDVRTCLHELAHSWCAYATFNDPTSATKHANELLMVERPDQALYHWGEAFDDERSCMDYDKIEWVANGNGTFTRKKITDQTAFNYCNLDLYLMGLMSPEDVGPIRILHNRRLIEPANNIYQVTVKTIRIEDVIASCGKRIPATSPNNFRQAIVVISKNREAGLVYAKTIENEFRKQYERQFKKATGGRATLTTEI